MQPVRKLDSPTLLVQLTTDELRAIIKDEIQAALKAAPRNDKLLTVREVCEVLNVNEEWLYHNVRKLPFARKVRGMLRFSANGLQRYIESLKFTTD